jgi:site-specific DNA recombinase
MAIHDRKGSAIRICCSTSRESGSCTNSSKFRLDAIEGEVFSTLYHHLMHPSYLEAYIRAVEEEQRAIAAAPKADKRKPEKAVVQARRLFDKRLRLFERGILDEPEGEAKLA